MMNLKVEETKQIVGGGVSVLGVFGIGSLIVFVAGIIDGIARPFKCH